MIAKFWHKVRRILSPPLTSPLVQMADKDRVVSTQTKADKPMMIRE
jgi:hypothetical protein